MTGREDGYAGHWDPKALQVNPSNFKRVVTPLDKRTTMRLSRDGRWFIWECTTCGEVTRTDKWDRPGHHCKPLASMV